MGRRESRGNFSILCEKTSEGLKQIPVGCLQYRDKAAHFWGQSQFQQIKIMPLNDLGPKGISCFIWLHNVTMHLGKKKKKTEPYRKTYPVNFWKHQQLGISFFLWTSKLYMTHVLAFLSRKCLQNSLSILILIVSRLSWHAFEPFILAQVVVGLSIYKLCNLQLLAHFPS